jgi:small subunit ribosomal protein S17
MAAKKNVTAVAAAAPVAQAAQAEPSTTVHQSHSFRRSLVGRVTSDKMDKTVTVEVIRNALDPVYKKYIRMRARYKAHDAANQYKTGDKVEIQEHRPLSRTKRWLVIRLVARQAQE